MSTMEEPGLCPEITSITQMRNIYGSCPFGLGSSGGLYVEKKLVLDRSTLSFQRCQALYGGGIFSKGSLAVGPG